MGYFRCFGGGLFADLIRLSLDCKLSFSLLHFWFLGSKVFRLKVDLDLHDEVVEFVTNQLNPVAY